MKTANVLTIDTSTPAVLAAVVRRDGSGLTMLAERITVGARAHAERLTPNIVAAVAHAGLTMAGLDAVVVGCGPGPFTGLRVGMATAAAIGHALGLPVHGVCSLDAIGGQTRGEVLVVTDARRREVYWARYRDGARVAGPGVAAAADVPVDGARSVAGEPEQCTPFADAGLARIGPDRPTPAGLAAAVTDWDGPPAPLVAAYLRRPDAKTLAERAAR